MAIYQTDQALQRATDAQAVVDALRLKAKAWEKLQNQDSTVTTAASGAFPGMTQVNWGGLLGNGLGIYNQLSNDEKATTEEASRKRGVEGDTLAILKSLQGGSQFDPATAAKTLGTLGIAPPKTAQQNLVDEAMGEADPSKDNLWDYKMKTYAKDYGVPYDFLTRIQAAENGPRDPNAKSTEGALGLMQVMPGTFYDMMGKDADINDQDQLMAAGAKYAGQMLRKYGGDERLAAAAYNAGPGNVDKYGDVPPFEETQKYVAKVTGAPYTPGQAGQAGQATTSQAKDPQGRMEKLFALSQLNPENAMIKAMLAKEFAKPDTTSIDDQLAQAFQSGDMSRVDAIVKIKRQISESTRAETDLDKQMAARLAAFKEANPGREPTAKESQAMLEASDKYSTPAQTAAAQVDAAKQKAINKARLANEMGLPTLQTQVAEATAQIDRLLEGDRADNALAPGAAMVPSGVDADGTANWYAPIVSGPVNNWRAEQKSLTNKLEAAGVQMLKATGVTPGQITEKEWPKMAGMISELSSAQDVTAYRESALRLKRYLLGLEKTAQDRIDLLAEQSGGAGEPKFYIKDGKKEPYE